MREPGIKSYMMAAPPMAGQLIMKLKVRELMKSGLSDEEILAYFVERYGEWILRAPSKQGFNLLLWAATYYLQFLIEFAGPKKSSRFKPG